MDVPLLIDAIVWQTTVPIAQLATTAGARAPLAHTANQVFVDLVRELREQGLGAKVIADMFGLSLRTYHNTVRRLSEGNTVRGQSLWEAVLAYIRDQGTVFRSDMLARFSRDGPKPWQLLVLSTRVREGIWKRVLGSAVGSDLLSRHSCDYGSYRTGIATVAVCDLLFPAVGRQAVIAILKGVLGASFVTTLIFGTYWFMRFHQHAYLRVRKLDRVMERLRREALIAELEDEDASTAWQRYRDVCRDLWILIGDSWYRQAAWRERPAKRRGQAA